MVAAAYVLWAKREAAEAERMRLSEVQERVFSFSADDILAVQVDVPGRPRLRLVRDGARYEMVEPRRVTIDQAQAWGVFTQVPELRRAQTDTALVKDPSMLKAYGLDPPYAITTAELRDGKKVTLSWGKVSPFDQYAYAQLATGEVILVAEAARPFFTKRLIDFLDRFLFEDFHSVPMFPARLRAKVIEVSGPGISYQLEKRVDDRWQLKPPFADDLKTARELGEALRLFAIKDLVEQPGDDAAYGLDRPVLVLSITHDTGVVSRVVGQVKDASGNSRYYSQRMGPGGREVLELEEESVALAREGPEGMRRRLARSAPSPFDSP
jgi:hypothetical protein